MDSELSDILSKRRNKENDAFSIQSDAAAELKSSSSSSSLSDKEEHSGLTYDKVTNIIRSFEPQQLSEATTRSRGTPKVVGAKRKMKHSDNECDATSCGSQEEKISGSSEDGSQANCTTPARGSASGPIAVSSRSEVDRKVFSEPSMPQDDQQIQEGYGRINGRKSKETGLSGRKEAENTEEENISRCPSPLSSSSKGSLHVTEDAGDTEMDEARYLCRNNVSEMVSLFSNLKAVANRKSSSTILVTSTSESAINDLEAQRIIQTNIVSTKALLFEKLEYQDSPRTPSLRPSLTSIQEARYVSTKASMFAKMQEEIKQEMEEKSRKISKRNSGICREPRKKPPTSPRLEAHPIMKGKGDEELRQKLRKLSVETSKEIITEEDEGDGEPDPSNLSIADRVRFFSPKISKETSPKSIRRPKTSLTSSFTPQSSNTSEEISSALNTMQSSDPETADTASASTERDSIRERNVEAIEV